MTTSVKVVHMSVPCVYSGRRARCSYPQRRAVSTRPAQSATGAGGGYPHASVGRTGPDVREPRPTMWWDGARRCTHIPVGMGVLLLAGKAAANGVNEAVDGGPQGVDNVGEEGRDGVDHDEHPFVRYVMSQDVLPC